MAIGVLIVMLAVGVLCACQASPAAYTRTVFAMDTVFTLTAYGSSEVLDALQSIVEDTEARYSVTRATSLVGRLNQAGQCALEEEDEALLRRALDYAAITEGAFDLTVYPLVRAWGFTTEQYRVPTAAALAEILPLVGYEQVQLDAGLASVPHGVQVDLGGIAKGYCGELLRAECARRGVTSAVFNLGGNVQTVGAKPDGSPWRVAIQSAENTGYVGVLSATDVAVVTSGAYERYFEQDGVRYGHILDPHTGYPVVNELVSVTVVGSEGAQCDAYATALYVMGVDEARAFCRAHDVQALLVDDAHTVWVSAALADSFQPHGDYRKEVL